MSNDRSLRPPLASCPSAPAEDGDDVMSRVAVTRGAVARWRKLADGVVAALMAGPEESVPASIPDEMARVEPDGSLTIFVSLATGEVRMRVEPNEWRWAGPPNH